MRAAADTVPTESGGPPLLNRAARRTIEATNDNAGVMTELPERIEHDSLGDVRVPADAKWGAQTQRAVENFDISGQQVDRRLIGKLVQIKQAAASVSGRRDDVAVTPTIAAAIMSACDEVLNGSWDEWSVQFPVDVFQTGSGTSTNMNVNEVIAHRAGELAGSPVHPNDHVNACQSSNDTFPTAMHMATIDALDETANSIDELVDALADKAEEFADVVSVGRTHLMDAAPVMLGDQFAGWAGQLDVADRLLPSIFEELSIVPLGGTAVGTGLNCPPGWAAAVLAELSVSTGREFRSGEEPLAAQAGREAMVAASGWLRMVATSLVKVANDLRLLASGPETGFGQITLPALQPGSSIMPGKVNPVMCETAIQVGLRVMGNDVTVGAAAASGQLELNTTMPLQAMCVFESADLLAAAARSLARRCVVGITADVERCRTLAASSPAIVTGVAPVVGYEVAAHAVQRMGRDGIDAHEALLAEGVDPAVLASIVDRLDPAVLARPREPRD